MKLVLLALSAVFACAFGAIDFNDWKKNNNKQYDAKAEEEAKAAFNKTVAAIKKHNANPAATYEQGVNENSDMTEEERQKRNGFKQTAETTNKYVKAVKPRVKGTTPASFNVTNLFGPVKNQGLCGCCYAMSTLSMIDAVSKRNSTTMKTKAMTFSDQYVIDCDTYDRGCDGGNPMYVIGFAYMNGLVQTANYAALTSPNTGKSGTCNKKAPITWKLYDAGYANLTKNGLEATLKEIVYTFGPATVSMDANDPALANYKSGVYVPKANACSSLVSKSNHVVVITGYGTDPKTKLDYWIVRNSWGATWGLKGYFWIKRGVNACGIGHQAWVMTS